MYCLSEKQIDYIFNDIRARGVEMESLQLNLHDHICCIIEQNLEEHGDFESFYQKTIRTFYKDELWEIEEETLLLLTYKNYYAMKKTMILSGTCSAAAMILGILFKFMHWPGASAFIILGVGTSSLIFLPLLFLLKSKDRQATKDKLILGLSILSGMLLSLSILFKVMHWPYTMLLGYASVGLLGLVLLPIYLMIGIKNPDNRINAITTSIVIIMICGLWLTLVRTPHGSKIKNIKDTSSFLINESIVLRQQYLYDSVIKTDSSESKLRVMSQQIISLCEKIKMSIVLKETGTTKLSNDFESKLQFISDDIFRYSYTENKDVDALQALIKTYDLELESTPTKMKLPTDYKTMSEEHIPFFVGTNLEVLQQLQQVQLMVMQNDM
jgi:uncharacterized membrane protein